MTGPSSHTTGPSRVVTGLALLVWTMGCGAGPGTPSASTPAGPTLGISPPVLGSPAPFVPATPTLLELPRVPPVWLLERHDVPLVAMHIVVPYGSAADPADRGGVAALTAEMMEQGAGRRDALALGRAAERLGADLTVAADRDASSARLVVLSAAFQPALELLADVVARPRFEEDEWARTHPLWRAGLASRDDDPKAVAAVVTDAALFGPGHPYGHPVDGTLGSVDRIALSDVRAFHARHWRPDRATLVIVGDVTPEQLREMLPTALLEWGAAGSAPALPSPPPAPPSDARVIVVDRPDSPQTVLVLAEPGPPAADARQVAAGLVNLTLGGTFTSRLNLNLREDKGYTYGARSSVPFSRGPGFSLAGAAVRSDATGPALVELRRELTRMQADGVSPSELASARASARGADIEAGETIASTADRLAQLAGLGLEPAVDASAAERRAQLDAQGIQAGIEALPSGGASIVAVGDPAVIGAALTAEVLGGRTPLRYTPDGRPLPAASPESLSPPSD